MIAGTANLLNLLDLRPGRALKATVIAGALTAADRRAEVVSGAAVGAAAALLGPDLAGETMLGDTGPTAPGRCWARPSWRAAAAAAGLRPSPC